MASAAKTLKRVTLELGGKDPAIVCKSVNIAKTAPQIATLAFLNSGQICTALKRIYIHKDIYASFRDAMVAHTKTITVGDGMVAGNFLGPIQNSMQYDRVQGFFDEIEKEGQTVAVGGKVADSSGYFIQPTIIDNPKEDSRLVIEEPFGMSSQPPALSQKNMDCDMYEMDMRDIREKSEADTTKPRTHRAHPPLER